MKLVVIDDEVRQCRSMKKIMEKLFPQTSVEIFTDPVSALEYIERKSVKIVITDICMPDLDGLTLVQKLMESDKNRKVILLTGYAEFEYARKAVSVGAYDFLLKPMNPGKLKVVVEKCLKEIQEELISQQQYNQMYQRLDAAWPVYMENFMNQWLTGCISEEEKEKISQIFPENKKGFLILTRFFGFDKWKENSGSQEIFQFKNKLGLCMREQIGLSYHSLSFFCNKIPETMATLVFPKENCLEYPVWMENQEFCKVVFPDFSVQKGNKIQMGVGMFVHNLEEEKKAAYESAAKALEYAFYFGQGFEFPKINICLRKKINSKIGVPFRLGIAQEEQLSDMLKNEEEEHVLKAMDEILKDCMCYGYPAPDKLIHEIERFLKHVAMSLVYPVPFLYSGADSGDMSYDNFRQEIYLYLKEFSHEMKLRNEGKKSHFINKFQEYMKEHYMENISLEDVANHFMLAPSYCSRLIKESMGSNFTQILQEERMKEAKELLRQTDMHIYEVAVHVGYSDVKYFNRVFKTSVGMTPQQFRRESFGRRT